MSIKIKASKAKRKTSAALRTARQIETARRRAAISAIVTRTARGRAELDARMAGLTPHDLRELAALPVTEVTGPRRKRPPGWRTCIAPDEPEDGDIASLAEARPRPPMAPPVPFEVRELSFGKGGRRKSKKPRLTAQAA